ncbi:MAG: putative Ig domain-containing protein, partial [Acidimicrobiia bacterium]
MIRRSLLSLVGALLALVGLPVILATTAAAAPSSGYWMLGQGGTIYQFGAAAAYGPATIASGARAVKIESKADGTGVWVVDSRGNVSAFGTAVNHSPTAPTLNSGETIVTMARTASGNGYWLVSSSGRTFNYGDAIDVGDVTDFTPNNVPLNKPVIDAAKAVTGNGMYLVAEDGGVFTMGDAVFYGSTGNLTLNSPVKSLVPDPDGIGYWLIAGDGGVFSFDATFRGSMGSTPLNGPVVGMVSFGNGYLQVGSDGGIFNFSNLDFFGSLGGNPPAIPIVSVAAFSVEETTSPSMTISTASLAAASQGVAYSATVAAANATGTVTWSATGLPTGMSISSSTGAITGRPSCLSGTTASVTVTATDSTGTANRTLSLAINALAYKGDFTSGESTADIKRVTNDSPVGINYLSRATMSANGCMLAFEDRSAALANTSTVLGALPDTNAGDDIFVLDRGSGIVRRITSGNQF